MYSYVLAVTFHEIIWLRIFSDFFFICVIWIDSHVQHFTIFKYTKKLVFFYDGYSQCWEGYFGNVIGYRLQLILFKM